MSDIVAEIVNRQSSIDFSDRIPFVVIIGVGGIGSWVAFNIALSGRVQNLILIDPDIVEESNLNRTPFRLCDIGIEKVAALKYLILERRVIDVDIYPQKTNETLAKDLIQKFTKTLFKYDAPTPSSLKIRLTEAVVIVDCRDDIYKDFYDIPSKYYKLGYDGMEITLDGDARNTPVWGRANGYRVTPSFICPSQLAANLVVSDIVTKQDKNLEDQYKSYPCDELGQLNNSFTFNCQHLIRDLYLLNNKQPISEGVANVGS